MGKTGDWRKRSVFLLGLATALCLALPLKGQSLTTSSSDAPTLFPWPFPREKEKEKPFVPHWSGRVELGHLSRQEIGRIQNQEEMALTGIYHFTESGHYVSGGVGGGVQGIDGTTSAFGEVNLEGGLGMGPFQPSLALQLQRGTQSLNTWTSTFGLDLEVSDFLTLGSSFWLGGFGYQGGVRADSRRGGFSFTMDYTPLNFLGFSAQALRETDESYGASNSNASPLGGSNPVYSNSTDTLSALSLGVGITFFSQWELQVTGQAGLEDLPAGTVYSPVLGETVTSTTPTTRAFTGYAMGLIYEF